MCLQQSQLFATPECVSSSIVPLAQMDEAVAKALTSAPSHPETNPSSINLTELFLTVDWLSGHHTTWMMPQHLIGKDLTSFAEIKELARSAYGALACLGSILDYEAEGIAEEDEADYQHDMMRDYQMHTHTSNQKDLLKGFCGEHEGREYKVIQREPNGAMYVQWLP